MPPVGYQATRSAAGAATGQAEKPGVMPAGWPGKGVPGGDVHPARVIYDPNPTYNGMAVDPQNGIVVMSDENRGSLLTYDLKDGSREKTTTDPRHHVIGGKVGLGFIAGVALDPGPPRDLHGQQRRWRPGRPSLRRTR